MGYRSAINGITDCDTPLFSFYIPSSRMPYWLEVIMSLEPYVTVNHNFSGGEKGIFLNFMFIILQLYDFYYSNSII